MFADSFREDIVTVHAYAAHAQGNRLEPHTFDFGALGASEVEINVSHCGICHSDIHLVQNDWGFSSYPLTRGTRQWERWRRLARP